MKTSCLVIVALCCSTVLFSQPSTFLVKAGANAAKVLPGNFRYLYPEYQDGYLLMWSGKKSDVLKYNYDLLAHALVCVNEKNDTLTITNDDAVKFAHIGSEDFYHDNKMGYLKILTNDDLHMLASHEQLEEVRHTQAGTNGYGSVDVGAAYTAMRRTSIRWIRNFDVTYGRVTSYYLLEQDRIVAKANRSGFLKTFPHQEGYVSSYLKKEKIDFKNEDDVVRLFNYLKVGL